MQSLWNFITDFGDTAITVPLALVMAGFLLASRQPLLALGWAVAIVFCAGAIGASKIMFAACGYPLGTSLSSPSGHTAMSVAVYGGYAVVVGSTLRPLPRRALIAGAVIVTLTIAVSRAILHFHSPLEVVTGLGAGLVTLALLVVLLGRYRPTEPLPLIRLAAAVLVVALIFHGERWPAEHAIHRLAGLLAFLRPWCS